MAKLGTSSSCECALLDDLAVIDMGAHDEIFRTLDEVRMRGTPWWWLYASACKACGQHWLVAQEERQNDIFILRRLNQEVADRLIKENIWPTEFDQYESLLRIGRDSGKSVRWADLADSSLLATIADLAQGRPGIRVSELASLLNLDPVDAAGLARQIKDAKITYDLG